MSPGVPIYQDLADRFAALIQAGTFLPGDKLPSIRQTSREHGVSVTTVVEAYHRLEDRGLVESHPRSGHFVKPPSVLQNTAFPTKPRKSRPVKIGTSSIFQAVMDSAEDRDMIPFAAASPDDSIIALAKLPSLAAAVFRKYGGQALRYTPPMGRRELRVALSRHLLGCGIKAPPDDIITTQGATEGLVLALKATTRPGDLVAIESPTYFGILNLIRDLGLKAIEIPVSPLAGMMIDSLEEALGRHRIAACIVQPNFQNPCGGILPTEQKKRLAKLSGTHGFTIIEDDVYGDLNHSGERPSSIALHGGDVIHCRSISKTIAPGLRVGWMVPGRHLPVIKHLKTQQFPWNGTLSELMVAEFLDGSGYDRHLRRIRKIHGNQCARVRTEVIRRFPSSCIVSNPRGGFVLWVQLPEGFDSEAYTVDAISRGISIVPGTIFSPTLRFRNCIRLNCAFPMNSRTMNALRLLGRLAAHHLPD